MVKFTGNVRVRSLFAGLMLAASAAQYAWAETYECSTNAGRSQGGYITEKYFFDYDKSKGEILVVDGLIYHESGGPIPAKLVSDNDKKISFSWSVNLKNDIGQHARLLYRAAYYKADHRVSISASVGGGEYVGAWDARGTCKITK